MATKLWARGVLPAAALLVGCFATGPDSAAAAGAELLAVWLTDGEGRQGSDAPALFNVPARWSIGDAAAVIVPGDWSPETRHALIAALLASGTAVLELNEPHGGEPRDAALQRNLREALQVLQRIEGAGLVVAIGFGEGGDATLAAVEDAEDNGRRYAAAAWLGPGPPRFRAGQVPVSEGWPIRGPLFCDLLAGVQPVAAPAFASACNGSLALVH